MVKDPATGRQWKIKLRKDLTSRQIRKMKGRPYMILQYAHYLRDRLKKHGIENPIINVITRTSLNYRPRKPMIDPTVNLAETEYFAFSHNEWILPFEDDPMNS